jgi:4-diphosphocytidyl-2-C-methyl-D-erythritol kinase
VSGRWFHALAPAKVNLTLEVLGRRPDGYHEIRTWMLALDLADRLRARATPSGGVRLALSGPAASDDVPAAERDLAERAAEAVRARAGPGAGLELELEKHIPRQAGLGGGSADAAAAWLLAREAWALDLPPAAARADLAALGSDCVFFSEARRGLASCEGRGEVVRALDARLPDWWVGIVIPNFGCATAAVYARHLPGRAREPSLRPGLTAARDARTELHNALEPAAIAAFPALGRWRALLDELGLGHWRLAGSGSAWFGIADERGAIEADLARIGRAARERGLGVRALHAARPAGHGACLVPET